jgi:hypothetical protein
MIYLLSDGDYSDYRIIGAYSTRELAEEAKKRYATDNEIEEMEMDTMPDLPGGLHGWRVEFKNDEIDRVSPYPVTSWYGKSHKAFVSVGQLTRGDRYVYVCCLAKDEDEARKIGIDLRPQALIESQTIGRGKWRWQLED